MPLQQRASTLNSLDPVRANEGNAMVRKTRSRVISGAVAITIAGNDDVNNGPTIMLQSMDEPSEETVGVAAKVDVLHLHTPLEWVAPAYGGGRAAITMVESWDKTPYEEAGFKDATEFLDVINHEEFGITIIAFRPDGKKNIQVLSGCRLISPIIPTGPYARGTQTRTMRGMLGYIRQKRNYGIS